MILNRSISRIVECSPGKYKGKVPSTNNQCQFINHGNDACVPCPGQTVKMVWGNSMSLCVDGCDGITSITNSGHSACGKLFKLFN